MRLKNVDFFAKIYREILKTRPVHMASVAATPPPTKFRAGHNGCGGRSASVRPIGLPEVTGNVGKRPEKPEQGTATAPTPRPKPSLRQGGPGGKRHLGSEIWKQVQHEETVNQETAIQICDQLAPVNSMSLMTQTNV